MPLKDQRDLHKKMVRIQAQHKAALKWLYDVYGNRQEGRSTLQMQVICELALENPGKVYFFQDHFGSRQMQHVQRDNLARFVAMSDQFHGKLQVTNGNEVHTVEGTE